jgi:integrase
MKARIGAEFLKSREAKPASSPFEVRDTELRGFILRVQPSGARSYLVQVARGRRITIGRAEVFKPEEARDRAKKILGNVANGREPLEGIAGASPGLTLGQFIEDTYAPWYKVHHPRNAEDSLGRIKAHFGHWYSDALAAITVERVENWRTKRMAEGTSAGTVLRDLGALGGVLSRAVKLRKLATSPMVHVDKPKTDRNAKPRFLSEAEEKRLRTALRRRDLDLRKARMSANKWRRERHREPLPTLPHFGDHLTPAVLLSINTGLRRGELLALRWTDLDLKAARLVVHGSTAKNSQTRHVDLNTEALAALKKWQAQATDTLRIFPFEVGFRKAWLAVLTRAKITGFRWHDLRHHFASRLVQAGVNLNTTRDLLGHGSLQMTLRYAHLAPDQRREAVAKLVRA